MDSIKDLENVSYLGKRGVGITKPGGGKQNNSQHVHGQLTEGGNVLAPVIYFDVDGQDQGNASSALQGVLNMTEEAFVEWGGKDEVLEDT